MKNGWVLLILEMCQKQFPLNCRTEMAKSAYGVGCTMAFIYNFWLIYYPYKMVWSTLCTADSTYRGSELVMPSVTRADMGAYMCIARNGVPPATSKIFKLIVNCKSQYIYGGKKIMRNSGGSDLPIFQQQKRVVFDKRTIKELHPLFLSVSWDLRA